MACRGIRYAPRALGQAPVAVVAVGGPLSLGVGAAQNMMRPVVGVGHGAILGVS